MRPPKLTRRTALLTIARASVLLLLVLGLTSLSTVATPLPPVEPLAPTSTTPSTLSTLFRPLHKAFKTIRTTLSKPFERGATRPSTPLAASDFNHLPPAPLPWYIRHSPLASAQRTRRTHRLSLQLSFFNALRLSAHRHSALSAAAQARLLHFLRTDPVPLDTLNLVWTDTATLLSRAEQRIALLPSDPASHGDLLVPLGAERLAASYAAAVERTFALVHNQVQDAYSVQEWLLEASTLPAVDRDFLQTWVDGRVGWAEGRVQAVVEAVGRMRAWERAKNVPVEWMGVSEEVQPDRLEEDLKAIRLKRREGWTVPSGNRGSAERQFAALRRSKSGPAQLEGWAEAIA